MDLFEQQINILEADKVKFSMRIFGIPKAESDSKYLSSVLDYKVFGITDPSQNITSRSLMPLFHTGHESHESPRIVNFRIREESWIFSKYSGPIRDALRSSYDTGTIELRIFVGFGRICTNIVKNSLRFTRKYYEYCVSSEMDV